MHRLDAVWVLFRWRRRMPFILTTAISLTSEDFGSSASAFQRIRSLPRWRQLHFFCDLILDLDWNIPLNDN